jgi:hypothetical protein
MTTRLAQAAARYAEQGWPVFPCKPMGKAPLTENGFGDATRDGATIEKWWRTTPEANIALVPAAAGFLVFDLDGPEGEDTARQLGLLSEPTLTARTGRGRHLYFRHPGFPVGNMTLGPHPRCSSGPRLCHPAPVPPS